MRCVPLSELSATDWNRAVDHSNEAWLFHRAEWSRIEGSFFARDNFSFAVIDAQKEIAGVCPLYRREIGRGAWTESLLDTGHHRQAGPAFVDALPPPQRKAAYKAALRHVLETAERLDVDRILLNAHNLAPANRRDRRREVASWMRDHPFERGLHFGPQGEQALPGLATFIVDQIVDLSRDVTELWKRLDEDCRNAVRKAQTFGFSLVVNPAEAVELLYGLARASSERTGETLAPEAYYRALGESLVKIDRAALLFAFHGDTPAAAVGIGIDKGAAAYLMGASRQEFLTHRVNNFIQWEVIAWAKARGLSLYRLGPIFPHAPREWPISRVSRFKGDFGGDALTIVQGCLFRKPEKYREERERVLQERS